MKIKSILLTACVALLAMGCSKQQDSAGPYQNEKGDAFLSLRLVNASISGPNAAPSKVDTENGTTAESKVTTTTVLLFDATDKCLGVRTVTGGTIGNGVAGTAATAFEVPLETAKIFVVLNNHTTGWDLSEAAVKDKQWSVLNTTFKGVKIANIATDDNFMMVSAGNATNGALTPVVATKPASNSATDIATAKTTAETNAYTVKVDRMSAKVLVDTKAGGVASPNGVFAFQGWELNITNKSLRLYSDLVAYPGATVDAVYRKDANFLLTEQPIQANIRTEFEVLNNGTAAADLSPVARTAASNAYCVENTMEAIAQKQGYTTKAVVKAAYTPTGVTAGDSYFRYQGTILSIDAAKAAYASNSTLLEKAFKADLPIFLKAAGIVAEAATEVEIDAAVAALAEGAAANQLNEYSGIKGRYKAVEYFHKSVCYYDVLIMHDQAITEKMALGRYGVVRNNWYKITINSVSAPGTPWIPDPTDPDDPTKPETDDDKGSAYLSVSITINPWTVWSQGADL